MPSRPAVAPAAPPQGAPEKDELPPAAARQTFFAAFLRFALRHFAGRAGRPSRLLGLGLVLLTGAQVGLMVRLNVWNADLFDALDRRSAEGVLREVGVFAALLAGLVLANAAHLQLKRDLQLRWRMWLTRQLTERWLADGRHFALSLLASEHATNPDGRIAEDVRVATEFAIDLATTLFFAVVQVVAFLSVLWALSGIVHVPFPGLEKGVPVPGHMVALALLYAGGGGALAYLLGRPLVRATEERQGREADFRFALSRARDNAEPLAMARAEPAERARLGGLFARVAAVWNVQTRTLRDLLLFSVGYGQLAPVLPLLVASPRYLAGALTLGGLVQVAQAFHQVVVALSWPVDNAQRLAEWRASAGRVIALRSAIATLDGDGRPNLLGAPLPPGDGAALALDGLVLRTPGGAPAAAGPLTERFAPGESVRLDGDPRAVSLLCKAVAGHWRWGEGAVRAPEGAVAAICVPEPWLPEVPLREILAGGSGGDGGGDAALAEALARVGLAALADRLDAAEAWHERLDAGARQRLAIARLLVRRPAVVALDHALRAVPPEDGCALLAELRAALPGAVLLVAGPPAPCADRFDRALTLLAGGEGGDAAGSVPLPRSTGFVKWVGRTFRRPT